MRDALWSITLVIAILTALFQPRDQRLPGGEIIRLEFAGSEARAQTMIQSWGSEGLAGARAIQQRDSWWPWLYGALLACLSLLAGGPGYAVLSFVAVVFDMIENIGMVRMLDGQTAQPWPALAAAFAGVKFFLIAIILLRILKRVKKAVI